MPSWRGRLSLVSVNVDVGHNVISRWKVLPCGECTCSVHQLMLLTVVAGSTWQVFALLTVTSVMWTSRHFTAGLLPTTAWQMMTPPPPAAYSHHHMVSAQLCHLYGSHYLQRSTLVAMAKKLWEFWRNISHNSAYIRELWPEILHQEGFLMVVQFNGVI